VTLLPLKIEGAGNAGCQMHPQPRVQMKKAHERVATGSPEQPGIPCATVYGLLRALSGDRALCHRPRATRSVVASSRQRRGAKTTRLRRPLDARSSARACVRRIPHPTFVTIAKRPSCGTGQLESLKLLLANGEAKYFLPRGLLEGQISRCDAGICPPSTCRCRDRLAARHFSLAINLRPAGEHGISGLPRREIRKWRQVFAKGRAAA
jgi:hypothetical protein